jgi:hypothetical protein
VNYQQEEYVRCATTDVLRFYLLGAQLCSQHQHRMLHRCCDH